MVRRQPPTIVLDAGALIALARGEGRIRRFVERAHADGASFRIPTVVIAETARGSGPRDAALDLVLHRFSPHPPVDESLARAAGGLLAASGRSDTVDALVAAEAVRSSPSLLLTGDPGDMSALLDGTVGVVVTALPDAD